MVENDHSWKQYAGISKGGARSMTEKTRSFIAHVETLEQNELVAIAIPAAGRIANQLKTVLEETAKRANFIASRPLNQDYSVHM
jgi:hypothetical protein